MAQVDVKADEILNLVELYPAMAGTLECEAECQVLARSHGILRRPKLTG